MTDGPAARRLLAAAISLGIVALAFVGTTDRGPAPAPASGSPGPAAPALATMRLPSPSPSLSPSSWVGQTAGSSPTGPSSAASGSTPSLGPVGGDPGSAPRTVSAAPTVRPSVPPTVAPTPTPTLIPPPTIRPTAPPAPAGPTPTLAGCPVFPADNVWNRPVTGLPVRADSATLVASIGASAKLHPDFGAYAGYGIPYNIVGATTPRTTVAFDYADESDQVPYPIPASPAIEAGSDAHLLLLDAGTCRLYELWDSRRTATGWAAGSGATWDLRSDALRPAGWTSADAAGLPILPGLVRYDEVAAGLIDHAIRFTAPRTTRACIYPARHFASSVTDPALPPMGLRVRLKASYDISGLPPQARVIARAMQTYGLILADNGSPWYFQGASDPRFDDAQLNDLKAIPGSAFEAVDTTGFVNGG